MHLPTQEWWHILETHALTGVTNFHINNQIMYTDIHTAMQMQHAVHCKCYSWSFTLLCGISSLFALLPWVGRISANLLKSPEEVSYCLSCRNNMTFLLPSKPDTGCYEWKAIFEQLLQMFSPLMGYCLHGCQRKPRWFLRPSQRTKGCVMRQYIAGWRQSQTPSHIVCFFRLPKQTWRHKSELREVAYVGCAFGKNTKGEVCWWQCCPCKCCWVVVLRKGKLSEPYSNLQTNTGSGKISLYKQKRFPERQTWLWVDDYLCCGEQECMSRDRGGWEQEKYKSRGAFLVTILSTPGTESTNNRSGWGQVFCWGSQ